MKERLLLSKLRIPKINCSGIARRDLLEKIHEMPEQLIVLHAGAGWGKTYLMAEYVRKYELPYSWYQIGHLDNDMYRFLQYFEAMLRLQMEDFCLPQMPKEWSQELAEEIADQILKQLEAWDGKLNLIFDDFQYIKNPLIIDFFSFFLSHMNERIRVFFLIKGVFPGFLTRFVLQGTAGILRWQELKITVEELTEHLKDQKQETEQQNFIVQMLDYTEGWPVAVNFWMIQNNKETSRDIRDCFLTSDFSEYLMYEILGSLSAKQKMFITESALLHVVTPEACIYILGMESPKKLLEKFVNCQLPVQRQNKEEYYYNLILRDFLREQVEEGRKQEIWKRAAQFYRRKKEEDSVLIYLDLLKQEFQKTDQKNKEYSEGEERLHLKCFGDIQIYDQITGKQIRWRTKKTKEMFAYFWEKKERALSKEEIMDALWEEGNGQNLESLFHTTLSYLKRAFIEVGISNLIQVENKKYIMMSHIFSADVQNLIKLYNIWKKDMKQMEPEQAFFDLLQAYRGDYMEELDSSWVVVSREYYKGLFVKCCELLLEHAEVSGNQEFTVRILEQLLKMDPYSERFNGKLIEVLGSMGEFQLAQQQYEHYIRLMQEELNIEIGRQIQEIYQKVMLRRIV